ncbi:MAG: aryl-sulfate sulfotransferase [Rhodocyclaceae bacterium]|nr:aryl-sulfate sulfotransferase [Rhodocyclaceae bacterium]MBR4877471.1 aryl-sulfate sulfotransferase [Rhodocyclaceae bacterium]
MAVPNKNWKIVATAAVFVTALAAIVSLAGCGDDGSQRDELPKFTIDGQTDLKGNFFISFVYSKNIIMLDGKGNVVWSKHEDAPSDGTKLGYWDFKKHIIDGKVYYSYHDQNPDGDNLGIEGFAPGERVILDSRFNEIKRITFEQSDTVEKGHFLDGHDFLLIDLDHYIMSGYLKTMVYNNPDYPDGSNVVYSYLQEVQNGQVVWDWKSIDYPELYSLTVTDATPTANDFANKNVDAPDYVHFNAMRLKDDGTLVCSFRHLNTILGLDRSTQTNQILWKLSGKADEFGLTDEQKTSSQHYVTIDGDTIRAFDNHNITQGTRIVSYKIDWDNMRLADNGFDSYRIDGKFSSACGAQQRIQDKIFMIGWGKSENDAVGMSVYDFATDTELIRMTLENPQNFTYRSVYFD